MGGSRFSTRVGCAKAAELALVFLESPALEADSLQRNGNPPVTTFLDACRRPRTLTAQAGETSQAGHNPFECPSRDFLGVVLQPADGIISNQPASTQRIVTVNYAPKNRMRPLALVAVLGLALTAGAQTTGTQGKKPVTKTETYYKIETSGIGG